MIPRLPEATRHRIKEKAAEMGYSVNPLVSAWLQEVRSSGAASMGASLAFVLCNTRYNLLSASIYQTMLTGARQEAQALGYSVAEFKMPCADLRGDQISRVLKARGARGVLLFDPSASITPEQVAFLERDFATVVLLQCGVELRFHTVTVDLAWNLALALTRLTELGYRRVALGIPPSDKGYALTRRLMPEYLYYQSTILAKDRVPPMPLDAFKDAKAFRQWLRQGHADALVAVSLGHYDFLKEPDGLPPLRVAFTLLSTEATQGEKGSEPHAFAGVENQAAEIGKAAAALLSQQVTQNRFGTPEHPLEIRIKGRWVGEGAQTEGVASVDS
jgi:LacI family transcriptional regulator